MSALRATLGVEQDTDRRQEQDTGRRQEQDTDRRQELDTDRREKEWGDIRCTRGQDSLVLHSDSDQSQGEGEPGNIYLTIPLNQ